MMAYDVTFCDEKKRRGRGEEVNLHELT